MSQADSDESCFAVAAVQQTLGRSTDVDACLALAGRIAGLMGQAVQYFQTEQGTIACQVGCHFCCHLRVMVYPHEAIALHRQLGSMPAAQAQIVRERLHRQAARLRESPPGSPWLRSGCAFLFDGRCSVYAVRPSACAGYHSLSRAACEVDHEEAGHAAQGPASPGAGIPVLQAMQHVATALCGGLESALNTLGLPAAQVELQTAVAALIKEPALIGRWRAGRGWPRDAWGFVRARK